METIVYLALGSNAPDPTPYLDQAVILVKQRCTSNNTVRESTRITTAPVGFESAYPFKNSVVEFKTELTAQELILETEKIERTCGRTSKSKDRYTDRTIDLDIILFGAEIIRANNLEIPHPRFRERLFVLEPLNELQPTAFDPVTQLHVKQLINLL